MRSRAFHVKSAAIMVAAIALTGVVGGCTQFDKQLGQQWIEVTFAPDTSVATAKHITTVCSHVPNLRLEGPVKATTAQAGVVDEVRYNSTNATDAQVAVLEQCLGKFPATVQGFTQMDQGDN